MCGQNPVCHDIREIYIILGTLTCCGENPSPGGCLIQRGDIVCLVWYKVHLRLHVEHTQRGIHDALNGVRNQHLLLVPAESVHKHSVDQDAILWGRQLMQ